MANIQTRVNSEGRVSYRVQIRKKGFPPQYATFERKTDAKRWAAEVESALSEGRLFKTTEARRRTFGEMIDAYLANELQKKSPVLRQNQATQLLWWKSQLGRYLLADVSAARIAECREKLLKEPQAPKTNDPERQGPPKRRSPATVARYLAALSTVYATAIKEWGWLEQNPLQRVKKPTEPRGRVRFLSDDERERLLRACKESGNPFLYPAVVLALSTGARASEIMTLTWDRVDLERGRAILEDTKNGERRPLHLAHHALEELKRLRQTRMRVSQFLFPSAVNPHKPIELRKAWLEALRKAQIQDFRFHDLRHSAASYLAMNGATLPEIAEILGHKTLAMVKRYAHLTDAHARGVVERMNKTIFSSPNA